MGGREPPDLKIEPLGSHHNRAGFTCGVESLDRYLKTQAGQDVKRMASGVFVLAGLDEPKAILGYYTLCATSLAPGEVYPVHAVNIDALAPARLLDCQLFFLGRPAANRPCGMRWMHRVQEQHRLVRTMRIQQLLISFDECLLFFRIEFAAPSRASDRSASQKSPANHAAH
jgi:hypothetical protein